MCGIVGYAGNQQALPILLEGLRRLEYRGYDSAGVAVLDGGAVQVVRGQERVGPEHRGNLNLDGDPFGHCAAEGGLQRGAGEGWRDRSFNCLLAFEGDRHVD